MVELNKSGTYLVNTASVKLMSAIQKPIRQNAIPSLCVNWSGCGFEHAFIYSFFFSFVFSPNQTWSIHNMNHSPRYEHCNLNMFHVHIFVRACVGYLFLPYSFENWIRSSVWPKITFLSVCHSACVWYTLPLKYCCRQFHVCGHQINAQIIRFIRMTTHRVMLYGSECIQNASHVFNEIVCKRLHCGSKTNINDNNNNNNCTQHPAPVVLTTSTK